MKLIDKDALLAEIDKRMEHLTPHAGQGVILTKVLKDHYEDLRNFINRMSEESASKDLEEAFCNYIEPLDNHPADQGEELYMFDAFKAGANWQKNRI